MAKALEVLRSSRSAYSNAGLEQAYKQLGLDQKLLESNTVADLAVDLDLHEAASVRFLCAMCFLGLVEKVSHHEYKHIKLKNYSTDASECFFG